MLALFEEAHRDSPVDVFNFGKSKRRVVWTKAFSCNRELNQPEISPSPALVLLAVDDDARGPQ
jgi:hypothetical protein